MSDVHKRITVGIELIDDPAWMGGTLYLRNLVICLARLPEGERPAVRLLGAADVVSRFLDEWGHLPVFASMEDNLRRRILRRLGLGHKADSSIDVVYPGFGAPIPGTVTVHWIPDFQHRYLPQLFSAGEIIARDCAIEKISKRPGCIVVLSSESAADDFRRFYPNCQATLRVWHFCSLLDVTKPVSSESIEKHKLPAKFLYLPNQFWAHKNHITVFKALVRLRNERGLTIPLVCTGALTDRRNEAHVTSLLKFIEAQNLTGQVHLLGLLDRNDQVDILRHAAAIIQPSLFEGWSTVVEDARACGRPIFLSDISVHKEQNPHSCTYFSAESDQQLAEIIACQWHELCAGPDTVSEMKAQQDLKSRIIDSARLFCDIVRSAME